MAGQCGSRQVASYTSDDPLQDLISRFTLDSATEFLFGKDVRSLHAGLPFPPTSGLSKSDLGVPNPADAFAKSFLEAQNLSATRGRYTSAWAIFEIFQDKVAVPMKVIDDFIQPILKDALEKQAEKKAQGVELGNEKQVADDETLLGHLVNLTDGASASHDPLMWSLMRQKDYQILRDETLNILLAGRDTVIFSRS